MILTGEEFKALIEKDPSWCKDLKKPLEITTFLNLKNSNITHLSPLITFKGNDDGRSANFENCKKIKIATGTFRGLVNFADSTIEKIEKLKVTGTNSDGVSATFYGCQNLKVAIGNYEGFVNFAYSGVTTIKDLVVKNICRYGKKAAFTGCPIAYAPKEYRKKEFEFEKKVVKSSEIKDKTTREIINKIKSEANNIEL